MKNSLSRLPAWLVLFLAWGWANLADANSYAFSPLGKEGLPDSVDCFACWRGSWADGKTKGIKREAIDRFLGKGEWLYSDPSSAEIRELGESYVKPDLLTKASGQLTDKEEKLLAVHRKYQGIRGVSGAFTDQGGRIFLWKLKSPRFLEIKSAGELCHLLIEEKDRAELFDFPEQKGSEFQVPSVPEDKIPVFGRGPLPATGNYEFLKREVLRSFLNPANLTELQGGDIRYLAGQLAVLKGGKVVRVSADNSFSTKTVNAVFADTEKRLWLALQRSEFHLELKGENGATGVLELPLKDAVEDLGKDR